MSRKDDVRSMSTLRFLVTNLLDIYGSLVSGIGFIVLLVAPENALQIIAVMLVVATVLFVGGYFLSSYAANRSK